MATIYDIPEIAGWRSATGMIRIPPGIDVPLSARVRRLIDTPAFRRLAQIHQLGLVSLVYPAANHSRQEHSLGVFQAAIEYLQRLGADDRFAAEVSPADGELFLAAALLHDVGHWPFGHPIEDMDLPHVPRHEEFARRSITEGDIAAALRDDWGLEPSDVAALVAGQVKDRKGQILDSMLSGPIDVDKVDYLMRDSLHAGVPYGHHFDRGRLVGSLCLNEAGDGVAITDKGKTAAEMMVFARYVMFSEVYWHHAVRSATAMLQRAFYMLAEKLDYQRLFVLTEGPMIAALQSAADKRPAAELLDGLFGPSRRLYKRLAQYSYFEDPELYYRMARQPYPRLVECAERLARLFARQLAAPVAAHEVLIDAPPVKLEVDFDVEVHYPNAKKVTVTFCRNGPKGASHKRWLSPFSHPEQGIYRRLDEVSPVVRTLAREQFDDYVKRVRIFVHPRLLDGLGQLPSLAELVAEATAEDA